MALTTLASDELPDCTNFFRPNRPVLVTTTDRDGATHVAPFAWCVPTSAEPPMVTLALLTKPRRQHSLVNIERDGQFVINFPGHHLATGIVRASYRYPAGVRKAAISGFEYSAAQRVNVPLIEQCRAHVECRLVTSLLTGDHTLLVADVVAASCEPGQQRLDGVPDFEAHSPCLHLGHRALPYGQIHDFFVGGRATPVAVPFSIAYDRPAAVTGGHQLAVDALREDSVPTGMEATVRTRVIADGFCSPEGPCCAGGQGDLFLSDWATGCVYRVAPDGTVILFADTGGMPSGACAGPEGLVYVCDPGRKEVLAISAGGAIRVIANGYQDTPFLAPNDCTVDGGGNLYFSDADGTSPLEPCGRVYIVRSDGMVELFAEGLVFPNGLAISAGGDRLYVAETYANRIRRFVLDERGHSGHQSVFAQLHGGTGPDGLAVDAEDKLYAAHFGKGVVAVLAPSGRLLAELPTGGSLPTNVAFWNGSLCSTELENGCLMQIVVEAAA